MKSAASALTTAPTLAPPPRSGLGFGDWDSGRGEPKIERNLYRRGAWAGVQRGARENGRW